MATSSANTPSERWKTLYDLEEEIKNFRSQQDNAKAGIDKHRKRYEDIKQNLQILPAEQQDQEKKTMKTELDAWANAEKAYQNAVKELSAVEIKKRKLMEDMNKQMSEADPMSDLLKKMGGQREGTRQEGRTEADAVVDLVQTIVDVTQASSAKGPASASTAPRTRSLANLPILTKPGNFMEHLTKLETYFRINEVTRNNDKKDILKIIDLI